MTVKTPNLKVIPISEIHANPVALREVDKESEKYQNLVKDIAKRGVLNAITVVEKTDPATQTNFYQIVDGLHRYSGACDAGLEEIGATVLDVADADLIETQIVANLIKVDTTASEYTDALKRMMNMNPTMTTAELAERISQSPTFVLQRMSLQKLDAPIMKLVDAGEIKLANAYALSKLPREHQHEWTDQAMTQQPNEFVPAVNKRVSELRTAAREGKSVGERTFEAVARLRKLTDIKPEFENASVGPALCAEFDCQTAAEGFALAIAWVLNMDPHSIASAKAKWEAAEKQKAEDKKRRDALRTTEREREARDKAAAARAASGMTDEEIEAALAAQKAEAGDVTTDAK